MNEQSGIALLLGLTLGVGLWVLVSLVPALSRPRLAERLAPYLVDISDAARSEVARRRVDALPAIWWLLTPLVTAVKRLLSGIVGGEAELAKRLRQAASPLSVERYRTEQAAAAIAGLGIGAVGAAMVLADGMHRLPAALVLPPMCAVIAVALRDLALRHRVKRRLQRIADEYPTVLEFLSLSLAAGEGIFDALLRVSRSGRGELASEFSRIIVRVRSGESTSSALMAVARELGYRPLERTGDHIVTAIERGAPLVEVLRAQANDARELAKRDLLEQAGRKEISMMVPLVLLVLPVTVLFAVFPSYFVLTTAF